MAFDSKLFLVKKYKAAGTLLVIPPILCVAEETHAKDYTDILCAEALASPEMSFITSVCVKGLKVVCFSE